MEADSPSPGGEVQQGGSRQPRSGRAAQVATIRTAILIGALVALVGGASTLATARLMDRQADLDDRQAEIAQLASQVTEQEAHLAQLASQAVEGADEVDRLNAALAAQEQRALAAEVHVETLEAERASLEEQLSDILNPAPGPTPTALLTVNWVQRATEFSPFGSNKLWVVVNVTIENTSAGEVDVFYSGSQFTAKDDQQFVYPAVFPTGPFFCGAVDPGREKILEPPLSGGSLGTGEKAAGDMAFDLPEGGVVLTQLVWGSGLPGVDELVVDLVPPQVNANCGTESS